MANHDHGYRNGYNGDYAGLTGGSGSGWGYAGGTNNNIYKAILTFTGGGGAHNNLQPYIALNRIIKY